MSWLLRKDLLILRRSRLLLALLVLYPVVVALLIGFAISRAPARPRVAIVDEVPAGETVRVGTRRVEVAQYARRVFAQVHALQASSRAQAVAQVDAGEALAAVVIPADLAARVSSATSPAQLEVLYNGNALQQSLARSAIESALAHANLGFSAQIQRAAAAVIDTLLRGGELPAAGAPQGLIGLQRIPAVLAALIARQPPGRERTQLQQLRAFASFAAQNLLLAKRVLATIGQPIRIHSVTLHGRRTPLDTFAVVVAVTVSLMFLAVLLAAGGIALEREEHALARLVRGRTSRTALLAEKGLLAAGCALVVALALLAGVGAFVTLDWGRVALWLLALACGGCAFAALGLAVGALAREVQAASLLAFLLSLPLAFLALVPTGAVGHGFYEVLATISFVFPFKPALQALDTAVDRASPSLGGSIAHLLVLALVFGALARLGLRRAA